MKTPRHRERVKNSTVGAAKRKGLNQILTLGTLLAALLFVKVLARLLVRVRKLVGGLFVCYASTTGCM